MDEIPTLGRGDGREFQELIAAYDAPAYVRRARGLEEAFVQLLIRCRGRREALLGMVRVQLGVLRGLAGDWAALRPLLADDEQVDLLRRLDEELRPQPRLPPEPTASKRALGRALDELRASLERFNRRWLAYLDEVDLGPVNELREGYNRYYVLEKECALRSARLARAGFRRLEPLTAEELVARLPPLPVPRS
jgi:hypothetical protein